MRPSQRPARAFEQFDKINELQIKFAHVERSSPTVGNKNGVLKSIADQLDRAHKKLEALAEIKKGSSRVRAVGRGQSKALTELEIIGERSGGNYLIPLKALAQVKAIKGEK